MRVFDPTQGFNAFAQGSQIGGNLRSAQTQSKLAPMLANSQYDEAMKYAASRGDMGAMDYIRPMAEKAQKNAFSQEIGGLLAAGDTSGAMARSFAQGNIDQGVGIYNMGRTMKADEITDYKSGIDYLVSNASALKTLPEDQRGARAIEIIQQSPFGQDPKVMAAVQQAAADGRLTDEEIDSFNNQLLTAGERLAQSNRAEDMTIDETRRTEDIEWRQQQAEEDARRFGVTSGFDARRVAVAEREAAAAAEALRAEAEAGPEINVDDEGQFRREYNTITKEFRDVQSAFGRIKATDASTAAGQISLVFQYMKMLDPGSTVREGEFANAENARGVPSSVLNTYNGIMRGKRLTDGQVNDFKSQAQNLYGQALESYDSTRGTYLGMANEYGFGADRTVPDLATMRDFKPKTFLERGMSMLPSNTQPIVDDDPEVDALVNQYLGGAQ